MPFFHPVHIPHHHSTTGDPYVDAIIGVAVGCGILILAAVEIYCLLRWVK